MTVQLTSDFRSNFLPPDTKIRQYSPYISSILVGDLVSAETVLIAL